MHTGTRIMCVLGILFGIMSMGGGGVLAGGLATSASTMSQADVDAAATATGLVLIMGAVVLISGIFTLLLGIFSVRGSNDFSKNGDSMAEATTRWCGKTWASLAHGSSAIYVDCGSNLMLAQADPSFTLSGEKPHVVDEWQRVPALRRSRAGPSSMPRSPGSRALSRPR